MTAACSLKRTCAFDMSKPVLLVHQMDAIYGRPPPDRAVPRATAEQKARAARTFPQPSPAIRGLVLTAVRAGPSRSAKPTLLRRTPLRELFNYSYTVLRAASGLCAVYTVQEPQAAGLLHALAERNILRGQ